ncbi:MAG: RNase J family beta-CASP ribonuclease [Candidatus Woesearchaeota archaeon]|nr:RNase J family beta-CASP ribonuclease [Candidatus Woesearchaeota archaeon]
MIEICAVGGYNEVGKNCTAINVDGEVVIFDLGLYLDKYIEYTEDEDVYDFSSKKLIQIGAVPDISFISDWAKNVKAIIPTHAHLDHIGAIPFLASKFDAEIICTPFSKAVLEAILSDEKIKIPNKIKAINPNAVYRISENLKVEFINMTHSTPQTVMAVLHTKYGSIVYANDFKFDNRPVLGKKPNFKRLREIGRGKVLCLILDSIYSAEAKKTPSESVAKEMLKDVMLGTNTKGKGVIVTTFSSHLARLKSIIEFGKQMNRKIVFLGRSLRKYVMAGEKINIINFSRDAEIVGFRDKITKKLRKISEKKEKYLLVVTGHQGEPKSVLSRIVNDEYKYRLGKDDVVIFSCTVIPNEINIENRAFIEGKLKEKGARIFRDIHVSGHCAREDQRDLIEILKPKHIMPAHGDKEKAAAMAELATEMGYKLGESVHIMDNGKRTVLHT